MEKSTEVSNRENVRAQRYISLRIKYVISLLAIVLLAVTGMGYFVFYRTQASNAYLVEQYDISVDQQIEYELNGLASLEANHIYTFFSTLDETTEIIGETTEDILISGNSFVSGETAWDANQVLVRLPNRNWDNPNAELASIFIPGKTSLNNKNIRELNSLKNLDYFVPGMLQSNTEIIAIYYGSKLGTTVYYPNVDLSSILPPEFDVTQRTWFKLAEAAFDTENKVAWSTPYQDAALHGLVITSSFPVQDKTGNFLGAVAIDIQLQSITERIVKLKLGKTGYAFLIDDQGRVISMPPSAYGDFNLTEEEINAGVIENLSLINRVPLETFEALAKMTSGQSGVRTITINETKHYIAYHPVPIVGYSLGIVVPESEMRQSFLTAQERITQETQSTLLNSIGIVALILAVALIASIAVSNTITSPLSELTKIAEQVSSGNLKTRANIKTRDELGILADTFNDMTANLEDLFQNLERRVAERTTLLEKRANQIQAAAEVGSAAASLRDFNELLVRTTQLISEKFGYYHVGIFLVDEKDDFAVLRASNSPGGAQMLKRGHRLKIGAEGIVGAVTASGKARIALDVGDDSVYFNNPDLPETRSEMALPLIAGGTILGALDVQSTEPGAFSQEDIATLQILADQLAVALQNARLFESSQNALEVARRAYGELSEQGWHFLLQTNPNIGFTSLGQDEVVEPVQQWDPVIARELEKGITHISHDRKTLSVPVQVRGLTIGAIRLKKREQDKAWSDDEIADAKTLANQLSGAVDSARLYQEAQRRGDLERLTNKITNTIRSSNTIENILQTTARELGKTLGLKRAFVQLDVAKSENNGSGRESAN